MNAKAEDHGNKTLRLFLTGDVGKKKQTAPHAQLPKKAEELRGERNLERATHSLFECTVEILRSGA